MFVLKLPEVLKWGTAIIFPALNSLSGNAVAWLFQTECTVYIFTFRMTRWLQLNVSGHCRIHALPNTKGTSNYILQSVLYINFIWRKREATTFKKRNFAIPTHQKEAADLHLILIVSEGLSEAPSYRDQRKRECVSLWFIQMSHSSGGDTSARGIQLHSNELLTGLKH